MKNPKSKTSPAVVNRPPSPSTMERGMNSPSKTEKKGVRWIWVLAIVICNLSFVISPQAAQATTYYVDSSRPDNTGNGLTPGTAKKTITAAIPLATTSGDIISVAAGTYDKTALGETFPIPVPAGVTLTGEAADRTTVIIYDNDAADKASAYDCSVSLGVGAVLSHLFVSSEGDSVVNRGAVKLTDNAILRDCQVVMNNAPAAGPGTWTVIVGGADNSTVESCTIFGAGTGTAYVAGILVGLGGVDNCRIYGNEIRDSAYGLLISSSSGTTLIDKNTIVRITMGVFTHSAAGGTYNIKNNILCQTAVGGGLLASSSNGIYRSAGTVTSNYNNIYGFLYKYNGVSAGANDKEEPPLFVNSNTNDYRLWSVSACRGAGEGGINMGANDAASPAITVTDLYIDASRSDNSGDGLSWGAAKKTLTAAVALAQPTTTVHLKAGTYSAGETFPLSIPARVLVTGESRATTTIEAPSAVAAMLTLEGYATLESVTVRGVSASGGGSVFIYLLGKGATVNNCIVDTGTLPSADSSKVFGIYLLGINCRVTNSVLYAAGGAVFSGGTGRWNTGVLAGSGTAGYSADTTGSTIETNEIRDLGIGIWTSNNVAASTTINRNTITGVYGGIILAGDNYATYTVKNNILANSSTAGFEISDSAELTANYSYNLTYEAAVSIDDDATITFNNLGNNINNQDPKFYWTGRDDYRLFSDSPAVNAADDGTNMGANQQTPVSAAGYPKDYYVSTGGDNDNDGTTASTAFRSITYGVTAPRAMTVNVLAGTYNAAGGESFPITIPASVRLKGVSRGDVVISGEAGTYGDGTKAVVSVRQNATLETVTISGVGDPGGGFSWAVALDNGSTGAQVISCEVSANANYGLGCLIINDGSQTVQHSIFTSHDGSSASKYGIYFVGVGGQSINGSIAQYNEIRDQSVAGIYVDGGLGSDTITINKNTIVKNAKGIAVVDAALGFDETFTGTANITNTIVASSSATGIAKESAGGAVTSTYNNVFANATNYSGLSSGEGDISADPLFTDYTGNDFRLRATSPCIDKGTPSGTDIGAYDYTAGAPSAPTGLVGTAESTSSIRWSWTHDGEELGGFYLLDDADNTVKGAAGAATSANTLEAGLSANTAYIRKVRAYNANGSSESSTATRYTLANVPSALTADATASTEVTISWSGDGTKYTVQRAFEETPTDFAVISSEVYPTGGRVSGPATYTDRDLMPTHSYRYRVFAYNGDNITTEASSTPTVTTPAYTAKPIIEWAEINRQRLTDRDNYIDAEPREKVRISVRSEVGIDPESPRVTFTRASDGKTYGPYSVSIVKSTGDEYEYLVSWTPGQLDKLEAGEYTVSFSVKNSLGNLSDTYERKVTVYSEASAPGLVEGTAPVVDKPTFSPVSGEKSTIAITLTRSARVRVSIFGSTGSEVYRYAGEMLAGYNTVAWNGKDPAGNLVGNGIYPYKIIAEGKEVGKGYLVVY